MRYLFLLSVMALMWLGGSAIAQQAESVGRIAGPSYHCTGYVSVGNREWVNVTVNASTTGLDGRGGRLGRITVTENADEDDQFTMSAKVSVTLKGNKATYETANKKIKLVVDQTGFVPVTPRPGIAPPAGIRGTLDADFRGVKRDIKDGDLICYVLFTILRGE